MKRRDFLVLSAAATGVALAPRWTRADADVASRPNILLCVSDDWGWPYYGFMRPEVGPCYGAPNATCDLGTDPFCQPYRFPFPRTPNLDALVAGGVGFAFGISTESGSTPTRQSIQTGLNRRDLDHQGTFYVRREQDKFAAVAAGGRVTIPVALEGLGYKTYGMGKWYVDGSPLSSHFNVNQPGSGAESQAEVTLHGAELFENFLDGPAQGPEPWYVMLAPYMAHAPYPTGEPYDYSKFKAPSAKDCGEKVVGLGDSALRKFLQSCNWFDTMVGRCVDALETRGQRENTIIMYTTDHGAALIRGKASFYENGMRTPIIANCPAPAGTPWRIPAQGLNHAMIGTIDIMPTILDYAYDGASSVPSWVPNPNDTARFPDALSLRPLTSGATNEFRTFMFSNRDVGADLAVREATYDGSGNLTSLYKLYVSRTFAAKSFYDLLANPFENPKQNLVKNPLYSSKIAALKQELQNW